MRGSKVKKLRRELHELVKQAELINGEAAVLDAAEVAVLLDAPAKWIRRNLREYLVPDEESAPVA